MSSIRFLLPDEVVDTIKYMYSKDLHNVRMTLDEQAITELAWSYKEKVEANRGVICAVFNDQDSPIATYTAIEYPELAAWRIAGTKILESTNHYAKTAKALAPAVDTLIAHMENKGYYKWWMISPEVHHNIRNKTMTKYSTMLRRYDWYDDLVIPPNTKTTGVSGFDDFREVIDWSDTIARMFVLKQTHRVDIFRSMNFKDYKGTLTSETI